tara:strand:+ start:211 stop:528 length:318 start_codon:yes stop_codon:yes gene_type:complete
VIDTTTYTISNSDFKKTDFGYVLNFLGAEIVIEKHPRYSFLVYIKSMDEEIPEWGKENSRHLVLSDAMDNAEAIAKNLWLEKQGSEFMAGYLACQHDWFKGREHK